MGNGGVNYHGGRYVYLIVINVTFLVRIVGDFSLADPVRL